MNSCTLTIDFCNPAHLMAGIFLILVYHLIVAKSDESENCMALSLLMGLALSAAFVGCAGWLIYISL